jgi:uncharacterized surface protein with fasciclin (FAS1) repeats
MLAPSGTYNTTVCTPVASNVTNATNTGVGVAQEAGSRAQQAQNNLLANSTWATLAAQTLPAIRTALSNVTSSGARNINGSYATFGALLQAAENAANNGRRAGASALVNSGRRLVQASGAANGTSANGTSARPESGSAYRDTGITVFAPSDQAIQTFLQQQGLTQQQVLGNQSQLLEIISYHIIPTVALSVQNLSSRSSGRLQTLLPKGTLAFMTTSFSVGGNNSSVVMLQDAMGSSTIRDSNMASGKVRTVQNLV